MISKYKDIQYVTAHPEIWSIDMRTLPQAQLIKTAAAQAILESEGFPRDTKLTTDPPKHTGYRAALRNAFTPARVRVTVNKQFTEGFTRLHDGDEIGLVPTSPTAPATPDLI